MTILYLNSIVMVIRKGLRISSIMNSPASSGSFNHNGGIGRSSGMKRRVSRSVQTFIPPKPSSPPIILGVAPINNGAVIRVQASGGTEAYEIYVDGNLFGQEQYRTRVDSILIPYLNNGSNYTIHLVSVNRSGKSVASNSVSVTPAEQSVRYRAIGQTQWYNAQIPAFAPVSFLVVGGGGGGGSTYDTGSSGGGGGGAVVTGSFQFSRDLNLELFVGAGGIGGSGTPEANGGDGEDSYIRLDGVVDIVAKGGQGGRASRVQQPRSGGGSAASIVSEDITDEHVFITTIGSTGGNGNGNASTGTGSGGGGGSSSAGGSSSSATNGGIGGAGTYVSIGGFNATYGVGGIGRPSSRVTGASAGSTAAAFTGNGGGGAVTGSNSSLRGGSGGSGVIIITY